LFVFACSNHKLIISNKHVIHATEQPMKTLLALSVSLLALSSAVAEAAPYAELNLGGSIPFDSDFKNSISPDAVLSFKPAFTVTAAGGYAFDNGLRAEFEYGWQQPDIDKLTGHS
jgi:opacity protein-like surface antigen